MATKTVESVKLAANVKTGVKASGADKFSARTLSDINPEINTDDAYSVISKFAALQSHEIGGYVMTEVSELTNA